MAILLGEFLILASKKTKMGYGILKCQAEQMLELSSALCADGDCPNRRKEGKYNLVLRAMRTGVEMGGLKMLNRIKYWILCKLLGELCCNSDCAYCPCALLWHCSQNEVYRQARKIWEIEEPKIPF